LIDSARRQDRLTLKVVERAFKTQGNDFMQTLAVVIEEPERLSLRALPITPAGEADVVVKVSHSGISTGTERLLWSGRMPHFPGMGYPLVPGYESVGVVTRAGERSGREVGQTVFVPGASCYGEVRGLFGGAASRIAVPGARVLPIDERLGADGVLLALAATARHAVAERAPRLIVGHGALGRLAARIVVAEGHPPPVVWETDPARRGGAEGYSVIHPDDDDRRDYASICDMSGDPKLLDALVGRLASGGEVVLAGFYAEPLSFSFPPFFMREARIRAAAQWQPADLAAVTALLADGRLSLSGLLTHAAPASGADAAYRTAFADPACLKMVLDWRDC
jgi:3-hydroxyethyl bacteriochlorophyllide a dehydrogenase